jgi:hypothetical protein
MLESEVSMDRTAIVIGGRRSAWLATLLLLGVGLALSSPVPAEAGVYHLYSCRTPWGAPAPTSGWSGSITGGWMFDPNSCASGGSLTAALDGEVAQPANTAVAQWAFGAAAGTQIAGARLWRSAVVRSWEAGNNSTVAWLAAPEYSYSSADVFEQCARFQGCTEVGNAASPVGHENLVEVPAGNLSGASHIYMNASCGGSNGTSCPAVGSGYSVQVSLYAADITLVDNTPPTVSNVGGSLASGGTLSGVGDVSFSAADTGSGLYEAVFLVDGHAVSSQLLNSAGGPCRNVGGTSDGSNAFFEVEPCPLALSDDLSFDTALAPEGSHLLTVQLRDAAGNATTILNRQVTFANHAAGAPAGGSIGPGSPLALRGALNGANASDQATLTVRWSGRGTRKEGRGTGRRAGGGSSRASRGTRKAAKGTSAGTLTSRYGAPQLITGSLRTSTGQPISGASLAVFQTPAYEGARTVLLARISTGAGGEFRYELPANVSSSALRFEYRSHQNDTVPVATAALTLKVRAGLALRIAPRVTSVGRQIFFSGTLHGVPIPPGGKQLVLEASSGGEWVEFRAISTGTSGRFHASYRFKFPGPIRYEFRVLCPHEADFPFLKGTSNVAGVFER